MDWDYLWIAIMLALLPPTGFLASILARAPSFLFSALWFSFEFFFLIIIPSAIYLAVEYRRIGERPPGVIRYALLNPTVPGSWILLAFAVNLLTLPVLAQVGIWATCVIASAAVWVSLMDRMPVPLQIGKRRISARLQRKLGRVR